MQSSRGARGAVSQVSAMYRSHALARSAAADRTDDRTHVGSVALRVVVEHPFPAVGEDPATDTEHHEQVERLPLGEDREALLTVEAFQIGTAAEEPYSVELTRVDARLDVRRDDQVRLNDRRDCAGWLLCSHASMVWLGTDGRPWLGGFPAGVRREERLSST
jgi:hypothetical protein